MKRQTPILAPKSHYGLEDNDYGSKSSEESRYSSIYEDIKTQEESHYGSYDDSKTLEENHYNRKYEDIKSQYDTYGDVTKSDIQEGTGVDYLKDWSSYSARVNENLAEFRIQSPYEEPAPFYDTKH